jgi:hypothetical protein
VVELVIVVFFFLSGRRGSFPISSLKESSNSPWKKKKEREREREREVLSPFQTLAACKNWAEMEYMSSMGSPENFNCG